MRSLFWEAVLLVDSDLEGEVFLVGEPGKEMLDQPGDVAVGEKWHFVQVVFLPVLGEGLDHEGIDGVDDVLDGLLLHAGALDVLRRRRGVLFLLRLLLVLGLLVASLKLFVNRSSQHHEERKEYVEVIRFC